jgi:hypothetical protein
MGFAGKPAAEDTILVRSHLLPTLVRPTSGVRERDGKASIQKLQRHGLNGIDSS